MSRLTFYALYIVLFASTIFILYVAGAALYHMIRRAPYDWKFLALRGFNYSVSFALLLAVGLCASTLVDIAKANMPVPVLVGIAYPFWFVVFYAVDRLKQHSSNLGALKFALVFVLILVILHHAYGDNDRSLYFFLGLNPVIIACLHWGFPFFSWGQQSQPQEARA